MLLLAMFFARNVQLSLGFPLMIVMHDPQEPWGEMRERRQDQPAERVLGKARSADARGPRDAIEASLQVQQELRRWSSHYVGGLEGDLAPSAWSPERTPGPAVPMVNPGEPSNMTEASQIPMSGVLSPTKRR